MCVSGKSLSGACCRSSSVHGKVLVCKNKNQSLARSMAAEYEMVSLGPQMVLGTSRGGGKAQDQPALVCCGGL